MEVWLIAVVYTHHVRTRKEIYMYISAVERNPRRTKDASFHLPLEFAKECELADKKDLVTFLAHTQVPRLIALVLIGP